MQGSFIPYSMPVYPGAFTTSPSPLAPLNPIFSIAMILITARLRVTAFRRRWLFISSLLILKYPEVEESVKKGPNRIIKF